MGETQTVKNDNDKLRTWQERLTTNESAYSAELAKMDKREALYQGDRKMKAIVSGDVKTEAVHVRNIVAEIIDPRHVDIIRSYDVHNVVISNRYISKMITQLSEDYELFNFYSDIMTYDVEESTDHEGREIYIKKAGDYFSVLPPENTPVGDLVRTVYQKSLGFWGSSKDFAVLLGYVDQEDRMHFFCGDEADRTVSLKSGDRLVLFSNH